MQSINFSTPQKVIDALKAGEKVAIFTLNARGEPHFWLSDIKLQSSAIFHSPIGILNPSIEYARKNYNKDIKLETLSSLCEISPSYFSRLFSKTFGVGINAYIISLRLDNAKLLLRSTNRTVSSIACEVGYVDNGYFCKLFKRHVGCTPLSFRHGKDILS